MFILFLRYLKIEKCFLKINLDCLHKSFWRHFLGNMTPLSSLQCSNYPRLARDGMQSLVAWVRTSVPASALQKKSRVTLSNASMHNPESFWEPLTIWWKKLFSGVFLLMEMTTCLFSSPTLEDVNKVGRGNAGGERKCGKKSFCATEQMVNVLSWL